jgi:hypothetical protein
MIVRVQKKWEVTAGATRAGLVLCLLVTAGLGIGCSGSETSTPESSNANDAAEPAANTDATTGAMPLWVERINTWPDTLRFTFDSTLEVVRDDLLLRLRTNVNQDMGGKQFENEQPLRCEVLMTVRQVPEWPLAKGLVLDSVVLHDPVRNKNLRTIPMLAFQRTYEEQTVRTQFLANMAEVHRQSPELTEGQELVPTIYLSWDGRLIIASMPSITLSYVVEEL